MEDFERQVRDRRKKDFVFIAVSSVVVISLVTIGIIMMFGVKKSSVKKIERTPAEQATIQELQNSNTKASITAEQKEKILNSLLTPNKK